MSDVASQDELDKAEMKSAENLLSIVSRNLEDAAAQLQALVDDIRANAELVEEHLSQSGEEPKDG